MNRYFYVNAEGKQKGTFSPEELRHEGIKRDTLVWTHGLEQWKRAEEIEELHFLFFDKPPDYQTTDSQPVPQYDLSGKPGGSQMQQPMPKTWLVESILVTILPFMFCGSILSLFGIIGIVYAAQVESFYGRGDYAASLESSRSAAKWTKITMWISLAWIVLIMIIAVLGVFIGVFSGVRDLLNT